MCLRSLRPLQARLSHSPRREDHSGERPTRCPPRVPFVRHKQQHWALCSAFRLLCSTGSHSGDVSRPRRRPDPSDWVPTWSREGFPHTLTFRGLQTLALVGHPAQQRCSSGLLSLLVRVSSIGRDHTHSSNGCTHEWAATATRRPSTSRRHAGVPSRVRRCPLPHTKPSLRHHGLTRLGRSCCTLVTLRHRQLRVDPSPASCVQSCSSHADHKTLRVTERITRQLRPSS